MHYVFLPVYNEEEALERVIQRLRDLFVDLAVPLHLLVVDDGSTDRSTAILDSYKSQDGFTLLRHEANRGIDGVFRTGIEYVAQIAGEKDTLVLMEADDTNDLQSMPLLLKSLEGGGDLVIASRFVKGGRMIGFPLLWRRFPCTAVNFILRLIFAVENVTDYTIFFRGYSVRLLKEGVRAYGQRLIETTGFVANAEVLLKLSAFKPRIREVPLIYRYNLKKSSSKLKIPFTILQYLKLLAGHFLRRGPPGPQ